MSPTILPSPPMDASIQTDLSSVPRTHPASALAQDARTTLEHMISLVDSSVTLGSRLHLSAGASGEVSTAFRSSAQIKSRLEKLARDGQDALDDYNFTMEKMRLQIIHNQPSVEDVRRAAEDWQTLKTVAKTQIARLVRHRSVWLRHMDDLRIIDLVYRYKTVLDDFYSEKGGSGVGDPRTAESASKILHMHKWLDAVEGEGEADSL